jgi:hypothetical protein
MTAAPLENPSWIELTTTFTGAGLPLPPIPAVLRAKLQSRGDWCWSTRPINGLDMYLFFDVQMESRNFIIDVLQDRVEDYAAVSHAGHGINSYAINFHLVHGPLAVVMQVGWGGVYMDNEQAALELAGYWSQIEEMLDTPPGPRSPSQQRLTVLYSDFRAFWGCGWAARPTAADYDLRVGRSVPTHSPFDRAVRLWSRPDLATVEDASDQ